jgi:hypothetical protein
MAPCAAPTAPGRLERWLSSPWFWCVLLAAGLAIRFRLYLFAHSYWYDESYLVLAVRDRSFADLLGPQPFHLVIPPVFLWLTRALFTLGGDSELLMRLPGFIADLSSLILMIPLARRLIGSWHAVWPFAFLAVSQHALIHASEVRPYTFDLLAAELVLLWSAVILDPAEREARRRWSAAGLLVLAAVGPWVSFPSVFMVGGAILAFAGHAWGRPARGPGWRLVAGLSGLLLLSVVAYWWVSGRHMYYPSMVEHWGPKGWGGFPDWDGPLQVVKWLLWRPYEIANYGNRDLGIILVALAMAGGVALARRSGPRTVVLAAPLGLATLAALAGKYPLVHRCGYFLLPGVWLLAAVGLAALAGTARVRGWQVAGLGLFLVAWQSWRLPGQFLHPDERLDYRGAYRLVHLHRRPGDRIFSEAVVVYQTYYPGEAPPLGDNDLNEALRLAGRQPLWVVIGDNRADLRSRFAAAGAQVARRYHVSGLDVLRLQP